MLLKKNPLFWLFIVAQFLISCIFIVPIFMFYREMSGNTFWVLGGAILIAGLIVHFGEWMKNGRKFGRVLAIQGTSFWGIGWAIMVLFEPQVGWWIFVGGWLCLAIGLFINGTADFHLRKPIGWAMAPLILGLVPPILEIANAHHFATNFSPLIQLQIMFLFASGWVLQGVTLTHTDLPELEPVQETPLSSSTPTQLY